jgi:anti-anti-sigma factor
MELMVEDLADGVTKAVLSGRMDIEGAQAVDTRFNVLAGSKKLIVVDMAGVSFLASMGLRVLMTCARSVNSKGGKMAIAGAQPGVAKVLSTSGIDQVVSVRDTLTDAVAALSA